MPSGKRLTALTPYPLDRVPPELTGGVVAVGNFDGFHAGHRALLDAARAEAKQRGVHSLVLTLEPHPRTVFRPGSPVFRLTPLPAKARLLKALAIDGLVVADFTPAFATRSPKVFIDETLIGALRISAAVIGFNFHFGNARAGTPAMLIEEGARRGFGVTIVERVREPDGESVSSSSIREYLGAGDIAAANGHLGYRWFVTGEVVQGDRRGRELGYPTANIRLGPDCGLRHGIYAVRMQRPGGQMLNGVASYGRRPTFDNGPPILEVFAFDFAGDLYGEEVAVSFVAWIRPEQKFDTIEALIAEIDRDSATARRILAGTGEGSDIDRALAALA